MFNSLILSSFQEVISYVFYIFLALIILLAMILVHELGHYISGKIFHFGIEEFAIGFGPKIFSKKKKNGEILSLRAIPLGGFCAFKGEDKDDTDPSAFNNKKPWQRIIVLISGALMNYIFAVLLILIMFGVYGHSAIMAYKTVDNSSVSVENRLEDRDIIISANNKNVYMLTDLILALNGKSKNETCSFYIQRNNTFCNVQIILQDDADFENLEDIEKLSKVLGINYTLSESGEITDTGFRTTGIKEGFFSSIGKSFEYSFKIAGTIFTIIGQLIRGSLGINSLGGTVTTISVTANAIKSGGLWSLLNIASFIGVNLAVFNLLPIPALDGSRVLFTLIEAIRRKPLNRKIEAVIHTLGFILIFLFAIFIDFQRLF